MFRVHILYHEYTPSPIGQLASFRSAALILQVFSYDAYHGLNSLGGSYALPPSAAVHRALGGPVQRFSTYTMKICFVEGGTIKIFFH